MKKHRNVSLFVVHAGCPHRCSFCDQRTVSGAAGALTKKDIDAAVQTALKSDYSPEDSEIAFFGGSFTAIDREYMLYLLECAYPYVKNGDFSGIRCSTRPDAIAADTLEILKKYGVTAIELGVQSMDDEVLRLNGRGHTSLDVAEAARLIKESSFSLGVQMMTGLFGSTRNKDIQTALRLCALSPDTARIYPTLVLKNTRLARLYESGEYAPQPLSEAVALCAELLVIFRESGVNVIRLGLHSGGGVEDGLVAGPYHPAFRELCESRLYLNAVREQIGGRKGNFTAYVARGELSKMIGQRRSNITALLREGVTLRVKESDSAKLYAPVTVSEE